MWALNPLRIEKGYRAWKGDLSTDYSLLEGGLERFVRFDKPQDFTANQPFWPKSSGRRKASSPRRCWRPVTRLTCRRSGMTARSWAKPPRAPGVTG
ncbi:MAG: hypothetical protein R3D84_03620 [Paracoccaceae bacterium]